MRLNQLILTLREGQSAAIDRLPIRDRRTKANIKLFCSNLYKFSYQQNGTPNGSVRLHSNYIRRLFGNTNASRIIKKMIELDWLTVGYSYSSGTENNDPFCKAYTLTYAAASDMWETFFLYHKSAGEGLEYKREDKYLAKFLTCVKVDTRAAKLRTLEAVTDKEYLLRKVIVGVENIPNRVFMPINVWNTSKRFFKRLEKITRETLLSKWHNSNFELIKKEDSFYYMPLQEFLAIRREAILYNYSRSIALLDNKFIYAHRDKTSYRLHSNFSNFPGLLLNTVTYMGEIFAELDLSNAQLCFCAGALEAVYRPDGDKENLITQYALTQGGWYTSTTRLFIDKCFRGEIYEFLQSKLMLQNRNVAKELCFYLLFSQHIGAGMDTTEKARFRKYFPQVISLIDGFKKVHGYAEFATELQRIETKVFIDRIWKEVKRQKIKAGPKHDSLLVYPTDLDKAEAIARAELNRYLGKGNGVLRRKRCDFGVQS